MRLLVLDTNALIQMLGAHSPYHHLWIAFLEGSYTLCISTEILFEYEEMLKQKASEAAADLFLKVIEHSPNVVRKDPYYRLGLITADPDDNKFVDCAFACQADVIVSDDTHFDILAQIPVLPWKKLNGFNLNPTIS